MKGVSFGKSQGYEIQLAHLPPNAGINERVYGETVCGTLKKFGYDYYHSLKKGLLKIKDVKVCRTFAARIKKIWRRRFGPRGSLSILVGPVFKTSITTSMRQNEHVQWPGERKVKAWI